MNYRPITAADDAALAEIIRTNLRAKALDIPGTAYFDSMLDHLSEYYNAEPDRRAYFVILDDNGQLIGGVGLEELSAMESCAELQKLYLTDSAKGQGLGRQMIALIEQEACKMGFHQLYLETHTNLDIAILLYEKTGFRLIDKPDFVVHSTMNRFYLKEL